MPGWHCCLLNHVQSNLPLVSRHFFFFWGGGGFLGCFFAHLPPWGCLQAGNSQGTHGHLSVPQCSLFVLQRLNINVEVLPVSQYGLQGNLMEMHQVCQGQDWCCPSKTPLVLQWVFPPTSPTQGWIWAAWCISPRRAAPSPIRLHAAICANGAGNAAINKTAIKLSV